MKRTDIDLIISVLDALKDAEYHTITGTTLKVAKDFHLTKNEINEIYESRKDKGDGIATKKIYTQVQGMVTKLRKLKYIKNFPGTKGKGIFAITPKGLKLFALPDESQIKKEINSELKKHIKNS
ncbi:MAG: hypothetical protein HOL90_05625 [Candidatus Nitrosopelagicus sp.]|jgi:hypothetical protein|nr:hypothetical protein [Candidatus Nitrosopelagicus sp.]MBT6647352.1 hypothetical protein [Nitrososphaerota archaeon]